jgi:hypothetical protein
MISIFALDSYIGHSYAKNSPESVRRLSSRIRGEEISAYLGARYNPTEGYENDVRIYVKPRDLSVISDGSYVDFLDGEFRDYWLIRRPKIKVIAASQYSYEYMKKRLPNEIYLIPSHHLNTDRVKRTRKEIKTCGYIGAPSPAAFKRFDEIGKKLKEIGMELVVSWFFKTKQDALDLYNQTDIFVFGDWDSLDHPYRIPTKIINAASFGIPSVAFPMMANQENEGCYLHARNMEETIAAVKKLKDETTYNQLVEKIIPWSENYHISKIAELYRKLK